YDWAERLVGRWRNQRDALMARGPDGSGSGGGAGFSLRDQLFNPDTLGDLAREYATLPGFDPDRFRAQALKGLAPLGLMARLDHIADAVSAQMPGLAPDGTCTDFPALADALEAAMPPPLCPKAMDNDFGRFIHAVPGILAVRHGMEPSGHHRDRALTLLHAATQRFSMEFYIRPYLDRWPDVVLDRLRDWATDDNYHVRRLVSEGTRPRLPWGKGLSLDPLRMLPLLDALYADSTRYVTRSVANHLNDLTRAHGGAVLERLSDWAEQGAQTPKELEWMTRHALRTAVKRADGAALAHLGYRADVPVTAGLSLAPNPVARGQAVQITATLKADMALPVMVDYRIQ
ncbi:MAG: hypothetical protein ACPGVS_11130, partial [Primorskyibacter sp.]